MHMHNYTTYTTKLQLKFHHERGVKYDENMMKICDHAGLQKSTMLKSPNFFTFAVS